jgi:hypothetical protein
MAKRDFWEEMCRGAFLSSVVFGEEVLGNPMRK